MTGSYDSEPQWSKDYIKEKDVAYWIPNIDKKITPEVRTLLEEYSNILSPEVVRHVYAIRELAWSIRSYPCTGIGLWLTPMLPKSPVYHTLIERLRRGAVLLEIGCFIGHDLRQLAADGAPSGNFYATDIVSHWDVGYEFFRDKDRFAAQFIESDILRPGDEVGMLKGKVDILVAIHVLHQWSWQRQFEAATRLCELSRPGAVVVGFQVGKIEAKTPADKVEEEAVWFGHSPETFSEMWNRVGQATGTAWETQASFWTWEEAGWDPADTTYLGEKARVLQFVVNRKN